MSARGGKRQQGQLVVLAIQSLQIIGIADCQRGQLVAGTVDVRYWTVAVGGQRSQLVIAAIDP